MTTNLDRRLLLFSKRLLGQKKYWQKKLEGAIEPTSLDAVATRAGQTGVKKVAIEFPQSLCRRLLHFCNHSDVTLYIVLNTVVKILVHRYAGLEDIIVASPVLSGNVTEETINDQVYIRDLVEGETTLKQLLRAVSYSVLEAYEHQDYPSEELLENRPTDISCSLWPIHPGQWLERQMTPLQFAFRRQEKDLDGILFYEIESFTEELALQLANHLLNLLDNGIGNADLPVGKVPMLSTLEQERMIRQFNGEAVDFPLHLSVPSYVSRMADMHPDKTAVLDERRFLTYKCLDRRAKSIETSLRARGFGRGAPAVLLMDRSVYMVECVLGIWRAGGSYLPMDTREPASRRDGILGDAGVEFVFFRDPEAIEGIDSSIAVIHVEKIAEEEVGRDLNGDVTPDSLAYVIYTSGSTGAPKGAMVRHQGMMNHIHAKIEDLNMDQSSVVAQNASHTFDISVWQFFAPLVSGGQTVVFSNDLVLDIDGFIHRVWAAGVTALEVVPSYLLLMLDLLEQNRRKLSSLNFLMVTGEPVKPKLLDRWFGCYPEIKVVNAYGPTEASDDITHHIMDTPPKTERVPVGKPIYNLNIYIVDDYMQCCPMFVKGEICVSGIGVGPGYLGDKKRTDEVFLQDPFAEASEIRMYKTGDVGRFLADGAIDFFGRKDGQVKVRGFRVELGEVEHRIAEYPEVTEAVVTVRDDEGGQAYLCGYLTSPSTLDIPHVMAYLKEKLPPYMVPSALMQLERFPVTVNGKVDRRALPEPNSILIKAVSPPRGEDERRLAGIWAQVLAIDHTAIGRDSNFFELGGHSLKATVLASSIHKKLDVQLQLTQIFKEPTLRGQAALIKIQGRRDFISIEPVEKREYYPVSPAQKRMFILDQLSGKATSDNTPNVLLIEGTLDRKRFDDSFRQLIRRHETLRTSFHLLNEQPVQWVHPEVDFNVTELEMAVEANDDSLQPVIEAFIEPFDLEVAPLFRVQLVKLSGDCYLLMFDMHHIIEDAVSADIFISDFVAFYNDRRLEPLTLQYRDYTTWQNQLLDSGFMSRQQDYWVESFSPLPPNLELPLDFSRPSVQDFSGDFVQFSIDSHLTETLNQLMASRGTTLYMTLLAVYFVLLHKYTGQTDVVVGTPVSGRTHADLDSIIGFFVNTLAMRHQPSPEKTFESFLEEVKERSLQAFENQDYPFDQLVNKLGIKRDPSRQVLFDTMFVIQNTEIGEAIEQLRDLSFSQYPYEEKITQFDIISHAWEQNNGIEIKMRYSTKLFKHSTMRRMAEHFLNIIKQVTLDPGITISGIEVFSQEEKIGLSMPSSKEAVDQLDVDFGF